MQQGKLVMSTDSYSDVKSRPKKAVSLICSSTSHPTPERYSIHVVTSGYPLMPLEGVRVGRQSVCLDYLSYVRYVTRW